MPEHPITLSHGSLRAEVDPAFGGRVTAFWSDAPDGRIDWLSPTPQAERDVERPHKAGMFPLVPFSNRIENARFRFAGQAFSLRATEPAKEHAIHGHGCRAAWEVSEQGERAVVLRLEHDGTDWPSPYAAEQTVTLGDAGLTVTLAMRNAGPVAIPAGLGWHPFLPVRGGVTLTSKFATVWPAIRDSIPAGPVALPGELDFAEGRELPSGLDTGFGGWDGEATVLWPNEGIGLAFTAGAPLGHVILYTPAGRDFFCLEPVTHAINAINSLAPDAPCGIRTLPRDGVFEASLTLRPFSAGTAAD